MVSGFYVGTTSRLTCGVGAHEYNDRVIVDIRYTDRLIVCLCVSNLVRLFLALRTCSRRYVSVKQVIQIVYVKYKLVF